LKEGEEKGGDGKEREGNINVLSHLKRAVAAYEPVIFYSV